MNQTPDTPDFSPGSLGCHEALYMAFLFADMVDKKLAEHPAVQTNHEWRTEAAKAVKALLNLYNMIADEHLHLGHFTQQSQSSRRPKPRQERTDPPGWHRGLAYGASA